MRPRDRQLLHQLAKLVRENTLVRTRHVRVELQPETLTLEIGGRQPPWWSHTIDMVQLERDPIGYAMSVVRNWERTHMRRDRWGDQLDIGA